MKQPQTVKGLFSLLKKLELLDYHVKGFDELPKEIKDNILKLSSDISNIVNEFENLQLRKTYASKFNIINKSKY